MEPKRLTVWAGWSLVAIAILHTAAFVAHPFWSEWLSGNLWSGGGSDGSYTVFWALPGGFVATMVLLGLLVARLGRRGETLPAYVGWGLGGWVLMCVLLIGPSGFVTGLVPAGLLIAESLLRRRGTDRHGRTTPEHVPAG